MILEKWPFVGVILWGPAAHSPLVTRTICYRDAPMWAEWALCCGGADYCGCPGTQDWPLVQLAAKPYLLQKLPAVGGWGHILAQLAARPGESWGWCWPTVG